jgi:hypothetical protein
MRLRHLVPFLILAATSAFAQGGLEVKVLSAKIVPNPRPNYPSDYKSPTVLQLEVLGTDRSGASSIEPRDKDIALYDCNGQQAARFLYPEGGSTRNFQDEVRKEIRTSLIFSVPEGGKQRYTLRWCVTRYAQQVTTFDWTGDDLRLPLEADRDGVVVALDELKIGHASAAEIAQGHWDEAEAPKMAADHLILTLRSFGLRHEATHVNGVTAVEIATGADGQWQYPRDPHLDCSNTKFSGYPADGTAGKLYSVTADTTCHFFDTRTIPKITRITVTVTRDVPFEEGWAPVDF